MDRSLLLSFREVVVTDCIEQLLVQSLKVQSGPIIPMLEDVFLNRLSYTIVVKVMVKQNVLMALVEIIIFHQVNDILIILQSLFLLTK